MVNGGWRLGNFVENLIQFDFGEDIVEEAVAHEILVVVVVVVVEKGLDSVGHILMVVLVFVDLLVVMVTVFVVELLEKQV